MVKNQGRENEMAISEEKAKSMETLAMEVICANCDEIDGYGFTRPVSMVMALVDVFQDGFEVGRQVKKLIDKNLIEVDVIDDTVWVEPEVYKAYI